MASPERAPSVTGFDHVTLVVDDARSARGFFELLGFAEAADVTVTGETMADYMGIPDWEAEHLTLRLDRPGPPQEVQLLQFRRPRPQEDPFEGSLSRTGFNHICFRVDDLGAVLDRLAEHGHQPRNRVMDFHDRRLVFFDAPGGIVVEFAEWH